MYQLINGKEVAEKIKLQVKEEIKSLGKDVTLAVVVVGDNPASKVYVNNKRKRVNLLGFSLLNTDCQKTHQKMNY